MVITPNTSLRLLSVPFDETYKDTIYLDATEQAPFLSNFTVRNLDSDDYTFTKKDSMLKVSGNADTFTNINYVMYRNNNFTEKWFYAFIERIEWASDQTTNLYLKTDVIQTWLNDLTLKPSLVIREHVADDTIGKHTVPENLELGEYVTGFKANAGLGDMRIVLATTISNAQENTPATGAIYGGVYSGATYLVFTYDENGVTALNTFLGNLVDNGKQDAVTALYAVPAKLVGNATGNASAVPSQYGTEEEVAGLISPPLNLDGYEPKNNKLFTDPYRFCYVHNNNGSAGSFPFELFPNNQPQFTIYGTPTPNPTVKLYPTNYRKNADNYDEALSLSGYPLLNWSYDTYKAWVAQQGASTAIGAVGIATAIGTGVATGGTSLLIGGALSAGALLAKIFENTKQPPQSRGNALSGTANASMRLNDFFIEYKTIRAEYARIIDEYFSMYGYKVNRVKNIEFQTRQSWNYIQVNDLTVTGMIPNEDMRKIKEIFQRGITFWHSADVGNYNLNNGVI